MLDLLSKTWRLLVVPLFAVAVFLGVYFYYYRGGYDPPSRSQVPFEQITSPSSSFKSLEEVPLIREGLLLVDSVHGNSFTLEEITTLLTRVSDRGFAIEFAGVSDRSGGWLSLGLGQRLSMMDERLRQAGSLAVILPAEPYTKEEVDIVERFVEKGGRLLLIADPTRNHDINSLAKRFGTSFQPGYLYNTVEYDINFRDIFVRSFQPDETTVGLEAIALYTAGSIETSGLPLASTDANTRSSLAEPAQTFHPIAKSGAGRVLAVFDLTFLIPPQNSIMDNDRLVSNIADFLTGGERTFELADFPYFFKGEVDILLGRASLVDAATELKSLLSTFQVDSEVRGVEDLGKDTLYLGLYEDSQDVIQYLDLAGIRVGETVRTPFTPDINTAGSAIILLHRTQERYVLVVLGDSQRSLLGVTDGLFTGTFRRGLVGPFLAVLESP